MVVKYWIIFYSISFFELVFLFGESEMEEKGLYIRLSLWSIVEKSTKMTLVLEIASLSLQVFCSSQSQNALSSFFIKLC